MMAHHNEKDSNEKDDNDEEKNNDEEENNDDENNDDSPFAEWDDSVFEAFSHDNHEAKQQDARLLKGPRDWGIPTFQDQVDRGVCTFTLRLLEENSDDDDDDDDDDSAREAEEAPPSVTLHLEHRRHSTGSDLWDAALVLAHGMARPGVLLWPSSKSKTRFLFRGKTILELGAGTGAVGLYAWKCLGASRVILTDLPDNLALLWRNYQANRTKKHLDMIDDRVTICRLDWKEEELPHKWGPSMGIHVILGSDLLLPYAPHLMRPLCRTIYKLLHQCGARQEEEEEEEEEEENNNKKKKQEAPVALLCYEERMNCREFFHEAQSLGLQVDFVSDQLLHPHYRDPGRIKMIRMTIPP